jgi:segregation and condensation protein B
MSLKAKLEAVIYAAEEPVTLAQLAMLFGNEALEWQAEQEAARAAEAAQNAEAAAEPPVNAAFDYADTNEGTAAQPEEELMDVEAQAAAVESQAAGESSPAPAEESAAAPPETAAAAAESAEAIEGSPEPGDETSATEPEQDAAAVEAEARRAARQRDREVRAILRQLLDEIMASYASEGRGVEIREIAGGFRMATKPEFHDAVRAFVKSQKPPLKLSLPALETLAVIAYKQPVTAPEVNEIRGVDSSGVFGSLLARKLIATAGRKQVIGRPILYKTTKEFLLRFGLKDLAELPSMEEFEKMAASELEDLGPAEAASATASPETTGPEFDENASEEDAEAAEEPNTAGEPENLPADPAPASPSADHESNPSEAAPPRAE